MEDSKRKVAAQSMNLDDADLKVGFIGSGHMARALCKGFIDCGLVKPLNIVCSSRQPDSKNLSLMSALGVHTGVDNREVMRSSDIVILAVKPSAIATVLQEVASVVHKNHLVISVAAGVLTASIEQELPASTRVVRVMPNILTTMLCGSSAFCVGAHTRSDDCAIVLRLFSSVGYCAEVSENQMDAVTAVSGSGPAYVFVMIEALADGAVRMGLNRDVAQELAAHTLLGASKMLLQSSQHPGQLKDMVCSPGGTTITGVHALEKLGLRAALMGAVEAAANHARVLANRKD